jgi:hypothetical protein
MTQRESQKQRGGQRRKVQGVNMNEMTIEQVKKSKEKEKDVRKGKRGFGQVSIILDVPHDPIVHKSIPAPEIPVDASLNRILRFRRSPGSMSWPPSEPLNSPF